MRTITHLLLHLGEHPGDQLYKEAAEMDAEIKRLRLEAARYRWLRASFGSHEVLAVTRYDWIPSGVKRYLDIALDEACDRGMRGEDVG